MLAYSCNNSANKTKDSGTQAANNSANKADTAIAMQNNSNNSNSATNNVDTSAAEKNNNADSMLSQMKNLTSMFGKSDSGILKNLGSGGNMDSMMQKMQSILV